ncbi:MAG: hypothetical protein ACLR5S_12260 [Ruminococcus sp.]
MFVVVHPHQCLLLHVPQRCQLLFRHPEQGLEIVGCLDGAGDFQRCQIAALAAGNRRNMVGTWGFRRFLFRFGCGLCRDAFRRRFCDSEEVGLRPEQGCLFHQLFRDRQRLGNLAVVYGLPVIAEQIQQHFQLGRGRQFQILVYHSVGNAEHLPESRDMYSEIHENYLLSGIGGKWCG